MPLIRGWRALANTGGDCDGAVDETSGEGTPANPSPIETLRPQVRHRHFSHYPKRLLHWGAEHANGFARSANHNRRNQFGQRSRTDVERCWFRNGLLSLIRNDREFFSFLYLPVNGAVRGPRCAGEIFIGYRNLSFRLLPVNLQTYLIGGVCVCARHRTAAFIKSLQVPSQFSRVDFLQLSHVPLPEPRIFRPLVKHFINRWGLYNFLNAFYHLIDIL